MAPKRGRPGRHSATGASTPLPAPSADVVFEILSWLPLRSLSRCRCVCTSWRAIISNPAFVAAHRSRAQPLLVAVSDSADRGIASTSALQIMDAEGDVVRLVDLGGFWKFRASLDSLALLTSLPEYYCNCTDVRVIDLATGETISGCPRPPWVVGGGVSRVTTRFGFGRAARSGTLKVIRILFHGVSSRCSLTCQVLKLGDNDGASVWTPTRSPPDMVGDSNDGVVVNGVLHFLSIYLGDILSFDLESEEWAAINGPLGTTTMDPWEKIGLAELNGALCFTHAKQNTVNLWLLTDVLPKDVWVKAYTISVDNAVGFVPLRVMRPSGKLLFYNHRSSISTTVLQVYDPCSGKCTNLQKGIIGVIGHCSSHLYVASPS